MSSIWVRGSSRRSGQRVAVSRNWEWKALRTVQRRQREHWIPDAQRVVYRVLGADYGLRIMSLNTQVTVLTNGSLTDYDNVPCGRLMG